jgi:hypothetical protein
LKTLLLPGIPRAKDWLGEMGEETPECGASALIEAIVPLNISAQKLRCKWPTALQCAITHDKMIVWIIRLA